MVLLIALSHSAVEAKDASCPHVRNEKGIPWATHLALQGADPLELINL
jgi:hypothetical protein